MPVTDLSSYLADVLMGLVDVHDGEPHPTHAEADLEQQAVALVDLEGQVWQAGDAEHHFPIQSMSKALVYGLAIDCVGAAEVHRHIDVEPSGDAFNRISLNHGSNRPANPMINAGALTAHSLVTGPSAQERFERIHGLLSAMAGRDLEIDQGCYDTEMATSDRNMGIAHMVKALSELPDAPHDVVDGYTRQCALRVSTVELARMGATLASGGLLPGSDERVLSREACGHVLSVMMTCGMYDAAGDWVSSVGIPAKSGIGGGILGAVPNRCGIATYSPRLDEHGNPVRGIRIFQRLSPDLDLHLLRPGRDRG